MFIEYKVNYSVSPAEFLDLLKRSTLAERRPIDDTECIKGMIENSNLCITAWDKDKLVGIARCMTDFHYACYLSDLAVDSEYQKQGIGKQLQMTAQNQLNEKCKLILISAPAANEYYEKIGFTNNERCWVLERHQEIK